MSYQRKNPLIMVSIENADGSLRYEYRYECRRGHLYADAILTGCPECRRLTWSEKKIFDLAVNAAIALSSPGLMHETAQSISASLSALEGAPALSVPRQRVEFEEWFTAHTVRDQRARTTAGELYDHYWDWSQDNNRSPLTKHLWGRQMSARFERLKSNVVLYLGVRLK